MLNSVWNKPDVFFFEKAFFIPTIGGDSEGGGGGGGSHCSQSFSVTLTSTEHTNLKPFRQLCFLSGTLLLPLFAEFQEMLQ